MSATVLGWLAIQAIVRGSAGGVTCAVVLAVPCLQCNGLLIGDVALVHPHTDRAALHAA